MSPVVYIPDIEEGKNLYFSFSILEYDELPIIFVCTDKDGSVYLCLCSESRYSQRWIITKTTIGILASLITKKETAYNALKSHTNQKYIVEYSSSGMFSSIKVDFNDIPSTDLPDIDAYVRFPEPDAMTNLYNLCWFMFTESIKHSEIITVDAEKTFQSIHYSTLTSQMSGDFKRHPNTQSTGKILASYESIGSIKNYTYACDSSSLKCRQNTNYTDETSLIENVA